MRLSPAPSTPWGYAVLRWVVCLLCLALSLFVGLAWMMTAQTIEATRPDAKWVQSVTVLDNPATLPFVLRRDDLGQRAGSDSAAENHLVIHKDTSGWWLQNIARDRRAELTYETADGKTHEYLMRRMPLKAGDTLVSATGAELGIGDLSAVQTQVPLTLTAKGQPGLGMIIVHRQALQARTKLDGTKSRKESAKLGWLTPKQCRPAEQEAGGVFAAADRFIYDGDLRANLKVAADYLNIRSRNPSRRLMWLGGVVSCDNRVAFPGVSHRSLWLEYREGTLFLGGSADAFDSVILKRQSSANGLLLADYKWPTQGTHPQFDKDLGRLVSIYMGRTKYDIVAEQTLSFVAVAQIQKFVDGVGEELPESFHVPQLDCMTGHDTSGPNCKAARADLIAVRGDARAIEFAQQSSDSFVSAIDGSYKARAMSAIGLIKTQLEPFLDAGPILGISVLYLVIWLVQRGRDWASRQYANILQLRSIRSNAQRLILFVGHLVCLFMAWVLFSSFIAGQASGMTLVALLVAAWSVLSVMVAAELTQHSGRMGVVTALAGGLFWAALGGILAFGSVTMLLLGSGAANSRWDTFGADHHEGLWALFFGFLVFFAVPNGFWRMLADTIFLNKNWLGKGLRFLLPAAVLGVAVVMFAVGSEEGLFGFLQPSEINKFALVALISALFAHLDRQSRFSGGSGQSLMGQLMPYAGPIIAILVGVYVSVPVEWKLVILGISAIFVLFLAFGFSAFLLLGFAATSFVAVPAALQDFSPIVISFFVTFVMLNYGAFLSLQLRLQRRRAAHDRQQQPYGPRKPRPFHALFGGLLGKRIGFYWHWAKEQLRGSGALLLSSVCVVFSAYIFYRVGAEIQKVTEDIALGERLLDFDSIERRFAVYLDPVTYIEWGDQLARAWAVLDLGPAASLFAEPKAWSTQFWASIASMNPSEVMSVPAIQDDLISAFIVARLGVSALFVLLICKLVFTATGLFAAVTVFRNRPGNLRDESSRMFLSMLAFGSVLLFTVHWCIAWMNLLGWAPIMGQPMSLVSYARSHMIGMGFPALVAVLIIVRLGAPSYKKAW